MHRIVGMALCALISLAAMSGLLKLMASSDRALGILGLAASLVCAIVLLIVLLSNGGGGGSLWQWVERWAEALRRERRRLGSPRPVLVEG